jgi:hypothetical protein
MIKLHARLNQRYEEDPFIARVVRDGTGGVQDAERQVLYVRQGQPLIPGYRAYLLVGGVGENQPAAHPDLWEIPESLHHLRGGDIIRISPRSGDLWVMYRLQSAFNTMLLTERCNCYCVMCSQPPKPGDDSYLVRAYLDAIPLMSADTCELGITGSEPTLLGEGLLEIIQTCKKSLPNTALHLLSNGRMFNYLTLCQELAAIGHPDLIKQAVIHLQRHGINVSIYNHQLCVLDREVWPIARKSISDWKNEYLAECDECGVRDECGGFFASSSLRHSNHIHRFPPDMLTADYRSIPPQTLTT